MLPSRLAYKILVQLNLSTWKLLNTETSLFMRTVHLVLGRVNSYKYNYIMRMFLYHGKLTWSRRLRLKLIMELYNTGTQMFPFYDYSSTAFSSILVLILIVYLSNKTILYTVYLMPRRETEGNIKGFESFPPIDK